VNPAQVSQQSAFLRLCQSRIHGDGNRRFEVEFSGVLPHIRKDYEHALAFRRLREKLARGNERSQDVGAPGARLQTCRACVPQEDEPAPRGSQTLAEVPGVFGHLSGKQEVRLDEAVPVMPRIVTFDPAGTPGP